MKRYREQRPYKKIAVEEMSPKQNRLKIGEHVKGTEWYRHRLHLGLVGTTDGGWFKL